MACEICDIIQGKRKAAMLYEDDTVVVFLSPKPAVIGHIIVAPKHHAPIFEVLPDSAAEHMFDVVNKVSIALFEAIKCEGTNLIAHNGIEAGQEAPHFSLNILARTAGDGMVFDWIPKQINEQELSTIEMQLKEELEKADVAAPMPEPEDKAEEPAGGESGGGDEGEAGEGGTAGKKDEDEPGEGESSETIDEENYLIKQLRRMP